MIRPKAILAFFLLALNAVFFPVTAFAQAYPSKPIRLIVPWPAGGATDIMARLVGTKLTEMLGQPVIVENKSGASGFIGTEFVAKAPPDGYTLLLVTSSTHAISPNLFRTIPYDPINDFATISMIAMGPMLLIAPQSAPFNSVAELVALAKAKPGTLNYATYGNGTTPHLAAELFREATGTNIVHIPYRGTGPASMAVISGEVSLYFDAVTSALPQIKSGKIKALASTGLRRTTSTQDIPTIAETYPGFEASVWYGLAAPARTPRSILDKLNAQLIKILDMPDILERLVGLGLAPTATTPEQFADHIVQQKNKWGELVRKAGIQIAD